MSHNCPCPNPPGGQIVCREDQLAICGFRDGKLISGCFDKPKAAFLTEQDNFQFLANWAVTMITGEPRSRHNPLSFKELSILRSGRYQDDRTKSVIRFSLPPDLDFPETSTSSVSVGA